MGCAGGSGEVSEVGMGRMSLKRWELVGLSRPENVLDEWVESGVELGTALVLVLVPAEGCCVGLKSDSGDAEEMKVEWEISVEPSTRCRSLSCGGRRRTVEVWSENEPGTSRGTGRDGDGSSLKWGRGSGPDRGGRTRGIPSLGGVLASWPKPRVYMFSASVAGERRMKSSNKHDEGVRWCSSGSPPPSPGGASFRPTPRHNFDPVPVPVSWFGSTTHSSLESQQSTLLRNALERYQAVTGGSGRKTAWCCLVTCLYNPLIPRKQGGSGVSLLELIKEHYRPL